MLQLSENRIVCILKRHSGILTNIEYTAFEDTDKQKLLDDFFNEEINEPIYRHHGID